MAARVMTAKVVASAFPYSRLVADRVFAVIASELRLTVDNPYAVWLLRIVLGLLDLPDEA